MEAIIESVDEFYSENLAQEVSRGMREAASRGFWMSAHAPFGYRRVMVQDGTKKRPKLELDEAAAPIVRRIFDMALKGRGTMEIAKTLNSEGIPSPRGKTWPKNTIHVILTNEVHTGTLVWGITAKDGAPPVRVEGAFPAIVTAKEYRRVNKLLVSRSPKVIHPDASLQPLRAQWPSDVRHLPTGRYRPLKPRAVGIRITCANRCSSGAAGPAIARA